MSLIAWYHIIEIQITIIDSGACDWQVTVTSQRIVQLSIELLVCSISPFPNHIDITWLVFFDQNHRQVRNVVVPLDSLLILPMFLRCYLFCRFMALRSRQFQDAATRSIASLNRVAVDFKFVLKTMMFEHPLRVLCTFTLTFWIVTAWIFMHCERQSAIKEDNAYLNSIWFIMITFKSIGYGDIVPNTYCGRVLAITAGIVVFEQHNN
uniref:Potassium channel domain-containing protein n=1 Tax=Romanomermis culicivorax TaxID=13658 RepID=A0A915L9I7_ROMCU